MPLIKSAHGVGNFSTVIQVSFRRNASHSHYGSRNTPGAVSFPWDSSGKMGIPSRIPIPDADCQYIGKGIKIKVNVDLYSALS